MAKLKKLDVEPEVEEPTMSVSEAYRLQQSEDEAALKAVPEPVPVSLSSR